MARPVKQGLDYFPFDVDLINDRKLRKAKLKHGYQATMVYIVLLTLIYKDKGYYLNYSDDVQEDVILDVIDCMQGKYRPDIETVREIIHQLAEDRLFDLDSLDAGFLTSRRIQQTYYKAVSDRKTVNIDWECWLLSEKDMQGLGSGNPILKNYSLQSINPSLPPINPVYHPDNTQSKRERDKSKGDKNIYNTSTLAVDEVCIHPSDGKTQSKSKSDGKCDRFNYQLFADYWNNHVTIAGLPSVRQPKDWNKNRKKRLRDIVRANDDKTVLKAFDMIAESDFLSGRATDWNATFDWTLSPGNFQKIIEGNYANRGKRKQKESYYDKVIRGEA
jgi:hypothetical protein